jgi:hypothetical protein
MPSLPLLPQPVKHRELLRPGGRGLGIADGIGRYAVHQIHQMSIADQVGLCGQFKRCLLKQIEGDERIADRFAIQQTSAGIQALHRLNDWNRQVDH